MLHCDHDIPLLVPLLDILESFLDALQRITSVDDRLELPSRGKFYDETSIATPSRCSSSIGRPAIACFRVLPSRYSIAIKRSAGDRILAGLLALLVRPTRLPRSAIALKRSGARCQEKRLRDQGTDATRSEQPGQRGDQVDNKNGQIAHRRIVAGWEILRNHGRNNNSPAKSDFRARSLVGDDRSSSQSDPPAKHVGPQVLQVRILGRLGA